MNVFNQYESNFIIRSEYVTNNLLEQFKELDFEVLFDSNHNIVDVYYRHFRYYSVIGYFFSRIAPIIVSGSYLQFMINYEGEIRRWLFKGGKKYTITPHILWPINPNDYEATINISMKNGNVENIYSNFSTNNCFKIFVSNANAKQILPTKKQEKLNFELK